VSEISGDTFFDEVQLLRVRRRHERRIVKYFMLRGF
jgi:hypothetical protein